MQQSSQVEVPRAKPGRVALRLYPRYWPDRAWQRLILLVLAALLVMEAAGRFFGLHTPILYEKTSYGYRPVPNQDLTRFGNHIFYDANGLRSDPVAAVRPSGTLRILFMGDSVVNGGARIHQPETIPYQVRDDMKRSGRNVEVLNASSPGWAIANAAAWLNLHGTFQAQRVVLVINTYDLFQAEAPSSVVGEHPSFPAQGPSLALVELIKRYLLPRVLAAEEGRDPGAEMSAASNALTESALADLRWMLLRARKQEAELLVVLVQPLIDLAPAARALSEQALARFRQQADAMGINIVDTRQSIAASGGDALFRDGLHPNREGNRVIAATIAAQLLHLDGNAR